MSPGIAAAAGAPGRVRLLTAALATVSALVALGLGEAAVRLAGLAPALAPIDVSGPQSPFQVSDSPILAYELKPNFVDPSRPGFRTNSHGLRGPERAIPKPPGVFRIALLGDSVVEGYGLETEEDTIGRQLEATLRARFEVVSAGVRGYNTRAEVELLRLRVLPYEPDLVVLVFVRNDHRSFNADLHAPGSYSRPRWMQRVLSFSHLFRLAAFRLNWSHFREEADPDYLEWRHRQAATDDNVAVGLSELASLSRAHGFRAIVAVWPNFGEAINDPPGLLDDRHPGRMRVEVLAEQHGFPVVRLGSAFRRDYSGRKTATTPRELYTTDSMHPSAEGARVAATILAQLLYERGLLGPSGGPSPR